MEMSSPDDMEKLIKCNKLEQSSLHAYPRALLIIIPSEPSTQLLGWFLEEKTLI